jgi:transposase-like protein
MKTPMSVTLSIEPESTVSEIASHYHVGEATVRRWVRDGMPSKRYNSRLHRYKLIEVEKWLQSRAK